MKLIAALHVCIMAILLNKKIWTLDLLAVEWSITDGQLVKIDLKIKHVNRTSFAISGSWYMGYEVSEDTMVSMKLRRSSSGNADSYLLLPYELTGKFYDLLHSHYKSTLRNFANCSNFPVIKTEARDYKYRNLFYLDKCTFTTDCMPNYITEGYYKASADITGETNWSVTIVPLTLTA
uniref:Uncharacterized protein n=1 Tax=Glossina brevipalpis TaxID=37001 RepID=A0A1A9W0I7_9MUSC